MNLFKKINKTFNGLTQKDVIMLIFSVGNKFMQDMTIEENKNKTLDEYGQEILIAFPDLLKLRKKEG